MEFIQLFVDYFCYYFTVYTSSAMLIVIVTKLLTKQKAINLSPFTLICHLEHSLKNKFLLKLVVKCFFCGGFFSPSLLMNSCLGNIQWSRLQLVLFLAATRPSWECFMSVTSSLRRLSLSILFLSLSSIHILRIESFSHLTSLRSSLFRARSRVYGCSRACLFSVSNSFR